MQEEMGQDARIPGTSVREAGFWGPGASWVQIRASYLLYDRCLNQLISQRSYFE